MPTFVLLLLALLPAALASVVCFLAGYVTHALWVGQLKHLPQEYLASLAMFTLEAAVTHAVLLGTPLFFALHRLNWLRAWSCPLAGLVLASLPKAIQSWPLRLAQPHVSVSMRLGDKMVQTVVNGVVTPAGWLEYARVIGIYAVLGAIGGLVFWLIWRRLRHRLEKLPASS